MCINIVLIQKEVQSPHYDWKLFLGLEKFRTEFLDND